MDENIDQNQSGHPVQEDEEVKQNDINNSLDDNPNNQAAGAIASSEASDNLHILNSNMQQVPRMVNIYFNLMNFVLFAS